MLARAKPTMVRILVFMACLVWLLVCVLSQFGDPHAGKELLPWYHRGWWKQAFSREKPLVSSSLASGLGVAVSGFGFNFLLPQPTAP